MSDIRETGGPAFPKSADIMDDGSEGMTMRDWFAGQALSSLITLHGEGYSTFVAIEAYRQADAMIAERGKDT